MAVWSQKWYIVIPLVIVICGHWSFLLHGMFPLNAKPSSHCCVLGILLKAAYDHESGCIIISTDSNVLAATFIYSMVFDFTVLSLTAWKLYFGSGSRSRLVTLIFQDGLIYFAVAYVIHPSPCGALTK
jgi:hypothetical protein